MHVTRVKLPLNIGSAESRDFHRALYYCWDVQVFMSSTINNFVKYKAGAGINYYYLYTMPYVIYMLFLVVLKP